MSGTAAADSLDDFCRNLSLSFYEETASEHQKSVWAAREAYHQQMQCIHTQILYTITTVKAAYERKSKTFNLGIMLPDLVPATGEYTLHVMLESIVGGDGPLRAENVQVLCRRPELVKKTWPEQFESIKVGLSFKFEELAMILLITSSPNIALVREMLINEKPNATEDCFYFAAAPGITKERVSALLQTDISRVVQPDWACTDGYKSDTAAKVRELIGTGS
ncbi:hypothetical protein DFJ77DRAFT_52150 [Powellomyces hirtus]|nr:hypothetical protein DFJ77DRAFT_52150 [Powellomyces hirtus]